MTTPAPGPLTVAPDRRRRLSDAVLVEASLVARLAGIRLLTIDATVTLVPADVSTSTSTPGGAPVPRRQLSAVAGHRLAEAVRSIDEAEQLLAQARRDGA